MCRLVSPPLWSRTSTPSSPLLPSSSTLTSSATSLSSYRRSCLSSFGLFHLYELFLTVPCVFSELGGGEWSCETEASESDWTDRQGGSLWGNHRKGMCRSYVYMKLYVYFCLSTKTELKVGLWTSLAANKLQCWNVTASDWCRTVAAGESLHWTDFFVSEIIGWLSNIGHWVIGGQMIAINYLTLRDL